MTTNVEKEGCLGDGATIKDYLLSEGDLSALPTLYPQDEEIYEYNQGSSVDCTIYAALGAVSDLMNYKYSKEHIKKLVDKSFEMGRIKGQGWYTQNACELVMKDWNNDAELVSKYGKIAYYRINKFDTNLIQGALEKNYTLVGNRSTATEFTKDYMEDAVLNGKDFGTKTNGHAIDIITYKGKRSEKNSYQGRKTLNGKKDCNIFELEHYLSEITNYGPNFYIFTKVKEDNFEELQRLERIKTLCNAIITLLGQLRHMVNDSNFQGILHYTADKLRGKIADAENEEKKFS